MKLYRHYKDKPYKYIGEARNSETLEEVVIYETLYENRLGKLWVRPKQMFFESVQFDSQSVPRFRHIPLVLDETTEVTNPHIERIVPVIEKAFGQWNAEWFYSRFKSHNRFHLVTALVDDQAVGFKLGYEQDSHEFYSWIGGVVPDFRGIGIASDLMKSQHDWCRKMGYKKVQTKTQNRFREMLILNLKHGFEVVGCHESNEGGLKIVLEKELT
ncbi:MAG: GNAT family N-acetyltransferase [Bdellovibrionales bacterium]|nr:GNAT family N-acetyltransferase [Bdellovibrionales bacterium]